MTNQELYKELKELREDLHEFRLQYTRESSFLKGKLVAGASLISVVVTFIGQFIVGKFK